MYHQQNDPNSKIVTLTFPLAVLVLDFGQKQIDPVDGSELPQIIIVSELDHLQAVRHIESFMGGFHDVLAAMDLDTFSDLDWCATMDDSVENRVYYSTHIRFVVPDGAAPRSRGAK